MLEAREIKISNAMSLSEENYGNNWVTSEFSTRTFLGTQQVCGLRIKAHFSTDYENLKDIQLR